VAHTADHQEHEIERLLRAREFDAALQLARRGVVDRPDRAAAHAMLGWALLQVDSTGPVSPELVDAVNRALRLDPEQPRGLYTKALAYRRMGREQDALRYFQRTARADPQHIDARRELRLAQMRGTTGKPTKKR
jgi:predicted Zn-dependent protease